MKHAIISDIHGNIEALEKVLERIENEKVDDIICLGDLVGYGPNPKECIERIQKVARIILAGNHDHAAVGLTDPNYFNFYAKIAVEWTAMTLSKSEKNFLSSVPLMANNGSATYVHATPREPAAWDYIMSLEDAQSNFEHFSNQVCFIGHSHVPVIIELNNGDSCRLLNSTAVTFKPDCRYIINLGSVGQPRDRDTRASFGVFDDEALLFELIRVEYPYITTQQKILKTGLPSFLAERLGKGI